MSRSGSSTWTSLSPLSLKMSPTSLVFGSHRLWKGIFSSFYGDPGSDWLLRRVVSDGSRGLHPATFWPRGNHQVVQLWRRPVPQQPKLPQLHQVAIIFETFLEILFRSERGSCYVEFQTDANHFMLEPVSTKRGGGAHAQYHLSEKAKVDIWAELWSFQLNPITLSYITPFFVLNHMNFQSLIISDFQIKTTTIFQI